VKKVPTVILIAALVAAAACASAPRRNDDFSFGNILAQRGLWKDALYRWQLALRVMPENAALHNNIAIAYEQLGRPAEAEQEYLLALKLAPGNEHIRNNYDRFKKKDKKEKEKEPAVHHEL